MNPISRRLAAPVFVLAAAILAPPALFAQGGGQAPENLQVLPSDMSRRDVVAIMRNFTAALGVNCEHCHENPEPGNFQAIEFASDAKETKEVARSMFRMVQEINANLIPASGRIDAEQVQCVTCHRGVRFPIPLETLILRTFDARGLDAAVERYRETREEYYGSGSYDFGPGTLAAVAQTLAGERNDTGSALAIARLNVEYNEDSAQAHAGLGLLLSAAGDREGAIAALERAIELDPDNRGLQNQLERIRGG